MSFSSPAIPGYRMGDPALAPSAITPADLAELRTALLFTDEDVAALRRAGEILVPRTERILDVWYGFVGSNPFLLRFFSNYAGPNDEYLTRVRARFGQWIADTCFATYDQDWLAWQAEIGRRHGEGKNETDGVTAAGTPTPVNFRFINALIYPIYATVRPFLEAGAIPAEVEQMHQAWLKAVLLQVTLWARAFVPSAAW